MTVDEMKACGREFLTPEEVAPVLGCKGYAINVQAQEDASKLGFPVNVMGTRVRVPRRAFLHWLAYGNAPVVLLDERTETMWDAARERFAE